MQSALIYLEHRLYVTNAIAAVFKGFLKISVGPPADSNKPGK